MTIFSTHPTLRWVAPAGAAVAVAAVVAGTGIVAASAGAGLAPRTAAQLLADVQQAKVDGLSGTVVQRADLGLPAIPGVGGSGSSDLSSLVSGTHTMRVWYSGPDKARLALLGQLGESDVVRNGKDVWVWSSRDKSATHYAMTANAAARTKAGQPPTDVKDLAMSPQEAADKALAAINPSTSVTTSGTATVAGRSAYELVLAPRDATSLVASVRIALDGERKVPLRVQIYSKRAQEPAFEVAFSSVDFAKPEASQFTFNPPPGTKVTEVSDAMIKALADQAKAAKDATPVATPTHKVVGEGWGSVLVATVPPGWLGALSSGTSGLGGSSSSSTKGDNRGRGDMDSGALTQVLASLPKVSGTWGTGRLLQSRLLTVVLADDGRVALGAVTPQAAYAALAKK